MSESALGAQLLGHRFHDGSWNVAVRPPRRLYGDELAASFGALCLQDARGGARQLMETEMPEVKGVWHAEDVALILIDYQKEMLDTSLALVTEPFRDRASPLADKAREGIKWYQPEAQKLLSAR